MSKKGLGFFSLNLTVHFDLKQIWFSFKQACEQSWVKIRKQLSANIIKNSNIWVYSFPKQNCLRTQVSKFLYKVHVLNGNENQYFRLHIFTPLPPKKKIESYRLQTMRGFRHAFPHSWRSGSDEMLDGRCSTSCPG